MKKGKNPLAALVIEFGKKKKGEEPEEMEDTEESGEEEMASDVMSALESGDSSAFASALKDFVSYCIMEHGE